MNKTIVLLIAMILMVGCDSNNPPDQPFDPQPSDNAVDQGLSVTLRWNCTDSDAETIVQTDEHGNSTSYPALTFDLYFGTASMPSILIANYPEYSYQVNSLEYETTYYWQVIADDGEDRTEGPIWSFTTQSEP